MLGGGTLWDLWKLLQYINIIILEFIPFTVLLYPLFPPFLEWFQRVSFFHLHICIHSICTIFTLLHPFPTTSSPPLVAPSPLGAGPVLPSCSSILYKKKEEKCHFSLFKIATQGVSLWHFYVYIYYNLNWFISSIFLHSTFLSLFLMVVSTSLKVLYSSL
jgi:hypothetical protein